MQLAKLAVQIDTSVMTVSKNSKEISNVKKIQKWVPHEWKKTAILYTTTIYKHFGVFH
ncbi:hypothetical protein WN55_10035 [Dufourea novaeangliae]|uniref:Uncharacterized protein n=1 Tax=Dufourea novaeangliae TaxID=178035 RepID=A0A154P9U7_DUFNO|nr:hypothetical protein WN55_10035 [Dufourea novaeangliae]